jgi:hypothetical protein
MLTDGHSITIRGSQGVVTIPPGHVHFTFASGRFSYDCVKCGYQCCRGHGYILNDGPEVLYQLEARPHLRFFLEPMPAHKTLTFVRNCAPACFFLRPDGLCSTHVEHGFDAKPETCRLFPFNNLRMFGDYLIVGQHKGLCPLAVLPRGTSSAQSSHAALLAVMSRSGVGSPVPRCPRNSPSADLIDLERRIRDSSEEHLEDRSGFGAFVDAQVRVTREWQGTQATNAIAGAPPALPAKQQVEQAALLLGVTSNDLSREDPALHRTLVAVTPYLRAELLFPLPAPRRAPVPPERLPQVSLATFVVAQLARLAGLAPVTFQTVSNLFMELEPLIQLLASLNDVMVWRADQRIDLQLPADMQRFRRSYVEIARALLPTRQRTAQRTLGALLCQHNIWEGPDRVFFLRLVSVRLHQRLVSILDMQRPASLSLPQLARRASERWLLNSLPAATIDTVLGRVPRRAHTTSQELI